MEVTGDTDKNVFGRSGDGLFSMSSRKKEGEEMEIDSDQRQFYVTLL